MIKFGLQANPVWQITFHIQSLTKWGSKEQELIRLTSANVFLCGSYLIGETKNHQ